MVEKMRARLWRRDMRLRVPVSAASQRHEARTHLFLELESDGVRGLGEISPQPTALHGDPGVEDVIEELRDVTLRQLEDIVAREGVFPQWARVGHLAGSRAASAPSSTLLEMALMDLRLRAEGSSLDDQWTPRFATPTQITVSLLDDEPWSALDQAQQARVKISTTDLPTLRWERLAQLGVPVLLDFNCTAEGIEEVLKVLERAQRFVSVSAIEQPFAPGNVIEHARLAELIDVAVSLDEGVRHRRDLEQIVRYRAAQVICVKPARVGGYAQARTLIECGRDLGLGVYLGGFFESPLARGLNRALARHLVSLPSDIAPASLEPLHDVLVPAREGCGYLAGPGLTDETPLVTRDW